MSPDCDLEFALASLYTQCWNVLLHVHCFTSCIAGRMAGVGWTWLKTATQWVLLWLQAPCSTHH